MSVVKQPQGGCSSISTSFGISLSAASYRLQSLIESSLSMEPPAYEDAIQLDPVPPPPTYDVVVPPSSPPPTYWEAGI
ncbi:hypothetical protein NHX12_017959 [Muraenolepis orangiensis]|uniref:Uncharacterized protein n=1 Tax=Muraenolepis orangiensis TaxID=630683 RepID=A0A9Q0EVV5_9TELE|nr:hypothetical protein NHX12_017959 [Muraenolepis orangiensis]